MQPPVQLKYIMTDHEFRVNSPQTQRFCQKWLGGLVSLPGSVWTGFGGNKVQTRIELHRLSFVTAAPPKKCWVAWCAAASRIGPWNIVIVWRWKKNWSPLFGHSWTFPPAEPLLIDSWMLVFGSFSSYYAKDSWMKLKKPCVRLVVRDSKYDLK